MTSINSAPWPSMAGTPYLAKLAHYDPMALVPRLSIPTLIIDAANEEFFVPGDNGGKAADILAECGIEVERHVIPGIDHYGIYFDGYAPGSTLALNWWERFL
ncbi:PhoPQ-activated pathogenicity-related family protein [Nocardia sp. NBC_00881]|uniref:PhoPQ-activated protein PqaA family protein n=1 Tax=Nocardia sp. NBC_00881 TaxID=2975995 RepID=UPI00386ABCCF|nr:PhoPQ-activated pathogenicity-related family protein [Nocardia sp. NBC_00881]